MEQSQISPNFLNANVYLENRLTDAFIQEEIQKSLYSHDFWEFHYIFEGYIVQRVQDEYRVMSDGDFCIFRDSVWHHTAFQAPNTKHLCVRVRKEFLGQELVTIPLYSITKPETNRSERWNYAHGTFGKGSLIDTAFRQLMWVVLNRGTYEKELLTAHIKLVLTHIARSDVNASEILHKEYFTRLTASEIQKAEIISYVIAHYKTVTRKELAQRFGYEEKYMSHLVFSITGMRFTELRQRLQLIHARRYIFFGHLPIKQAAQEAGFQNMTHFYRLYKKHFSCLPTDLNASTYTPDDDIQFFQSLQSGQNSIEEQEQEDNM